MGTPSPFEVSRLIGNNFGKTNRENRDVSAIDEILTQASQSGDPKQLQNSIGQILSRVSPERQPQAIKVLEDRYKAIQQQQNVQVEKQAAKTGGFTYGAPPQVQAQEVKNKHNVEHPKKEKETPNPFEKPAVDRITKIIQEAEHYAPIRSSLNEMKELSKQFQGISSYITANVPGTASNRAASEFEAQSDLVLEPVFKLYNPAGALAQTKVTLLRERLKPKWNDTQATIDAKISALDKLIEAKQKQADKYKKLIRENNGKLSAEQLYGEEDYDDKIIEQIDAETKNLEAPKDGNQSLESIWGS